MGVRFGSALSSAPPALPSAAGVLGADVVLVAATDTLVLTTAALAIGAWVVTMGAEISNGAALASDALIYVAPGTATAVFGGPIAADTELPGVIGQAAALSFSVIATVTVAGTLTLRVQSAQVATVRQLATAAGARAVTGYVAVKIA